MLIDRFEIERKQNDLFFSSHPQSALSPIRRSASRILTYWPPNPEYRFKFQLREQADKATMPETLHNKN